MMTLSETVGQMVAERPMRARIFEEAGIDYCCGHDQTLEEACWRTGNDPESLLDRFAAIDRDRSQRNWSDISLSELCDDIVATYQQPLREELPRIGMLLYHVAEGHGFRHPELNRVLELFSLLSGDLKLHMTREDEFVFPMIADRESGRPVDEEDLVQIIERLELEHGAAAQTLDEIRQLTQDFHIPADACGTYRTVLESLQGLSRDLQELNGIEENILFPRVLQMS